MIEKVNPKHPDKIADRIAGAIVDLAYKLEKEPKVAVEVLIGHGKCHVIIETSVDFEKKSIHRIIRRIAGVVHPDVNIVSQDKKLNKNQNDKIRCGDNGIFKGMPITKEQSNVKTKVLKKLYPNAKINPLGNWTGGTDVDTGATNRKLGSDMADSVTGGGLHGKDLSKADVSVNIYAFLRAQQLQSPVEFSCAIGDESIGDMPYEEIVRIAKEYIDSVGGFEKFAEWGLF